MKTHNTHHKNSLKAALCAAAVALGLASGIRTADAAIASNFTIVNHATGLPLSLYDYQGSVILLDFWAYWCGPCMGASADIEPNVTQNYRNAGGNTNGVPVTVISVSIDCGDAASATTYIQNYGLELVADDCSDLAFSQFSSGYIPQFVVINGTTNSSNFSAWQILYSPYGYATNSTVPTLKSYINSVQTPAPITTVTNPVAGAVVASGNILLGATLTTNGKIIKKVEFYNGATLLGSTTNAPYSLIWSNVSTGAKSVIARAYYGTSAAVNSAAVNFTVAAPVGVSLTTPQFTASKTNFNFLLSGPAGSNYVLQVSTNLSSWSSVSTSAIPASGSVTLTNSTTGYNRRFYRVHLQ